MFWECFLCFPTTLHAHKQIHHWFFWRKSAQDIGSFENGTKAVIFISLKKFPKPAKMLYMSYNVNFNLNFNKTLYMPEGNRTEKV